MSGPGEAVLELGKIGEILDGIRFGHNKVCCFCPGLGEIMYCFGGDPWRSFAMPSGAAEPSMSSVAPTVERFTAAALQAVVPCLTSM